MYYIVFTLLLTGCAHPRADQWWPGDHHKMMGECRVLCRNNVKGYSALDGECVCHKRGIE